jgi:hypothetical protein
MTKPVSNAKPRLTELPSCKNLITAKPHIVNLQLAVLSARLIVTRESLIAKNFHWLKV